MRPIKNKRRRDPRYFLHESADPDSDADDAAELRNIATDLEGGGVSDIDPDEIVGVVNMLRWEYGLNKGLSPDDPSYIPRESQDKLAADVIKQNPDMDLIDWEETTMPSEESVIALGAKHGIPLVGSDESLAAAFVRGSSEEYNKRAAAAKAHRALHGPGLSAREQAAELARQGRGPDQYTSRHD